MAKPALTQPHTPTTAPRTLNEPARDCCQHNIGALVYQHAEREAEKVAHSQKSAAPYRSARLELSAGQIKAAPYEEATAVSQLARIKAPTNKIQRF
jgi:hypothetical protein